MTKPGPGPHTPIEWEPIEGLEVQEASPIDWLLAGGVPIEFQWLDTQGER